MKPSLLTAALAGAALFAAAPAFAQHGPPAGVGGGFGPGGPGGMGAPSIGMPGGNDWGQTKRDQARDQSRAAEHAAEQARMRADANSAIFADSNARVRMRDRDDDQDRNTHGVTTRTVCTW